MVDLNQYYTSGDTSKLLASMLDLSDVRSCIELSAGEGALIAPIKDKSQNVSFTSVDLDPLNIKKLEVKYPEDIHICGDALDPNISVKNASFDLAVCNPPFSNGALDQRALDILGDDFKKFFYKGKKIRLEVLFILKNISLLKDNALLAIIVPDLIVSSASLSGFREQLFTSFKLEGVVELEHGVFKKTEAKTYILYIRKTKPHYEYKTAFYVKYNSCNEQYSGTFNISSLYKEDKSKKIDGVTIFRGSTSSKQCRDSNFQFHHTFSEIKDFSTVIYPHIERELVGFKYAITGDILIDRVGRSVGKTVFLNEGKIIISDCIIVIRFVSERLKLKFIYEWSKNRDRWLEKHVKGTCAKNISIKSINEFIISISPDDARMVD
ncbi:N-6 DNA methylase [Aeromonas sp. 102P]|uniref:N-6 DNA methylase n=1 Tax=Aeromonas sp. 102P TaxID=3452711 RepID=UPI003F7B1595|nr:SAM-dependent DNA methyltransferase [Aeromonas veronii]